MKRKKNKVSVNKKKPSVERIGFLIFFLSLLVSVTYFLVKNRDNFNWGNNSNTDGDSVSSTQPNSTSTEIEWLIYNNDDFGFTVEYPGDLTLDQIGDHGEYLDFIRFVQYDENVKSKGIMIGISKTSLEDEITKVKKDIENEEEAKLVKEQDMNVYGLRAKGLLYSPVSEENLKGVILEERAIIIIEREELVFSVSTVPEQIDAIVSSMTFKDPQTDLSQY